MTGTDMNDTSTPKDEDLPRRRFLKSGLAAGAALGAAQAVLAAQTPPDATAMAKMDPMRSVEPFYGPHQGGIVTPQQSHTYVASLDLVTEKRDELVGLLRTWTEASASMARGDTAKPLPPSDADAAPDSGDALGLGRLWARLPYVRDHAWLR